MKQYEITVDGQVYRVSLREIDEQEAEQKNKSTKPNVESREKSSEGKEILAPMAGNILAVHIKPGDRVNIGDTLIVLEAMKMENEIVSPVDGIVTEVLIESNQTVESGQLLVLI